MRRNQIRQNYDSAVELSQELRTTEPNYPTSLPQSRKILTSLRKQLLKRDNIRAEIQTLADSIGRRANIAEQNYKLLYKQLRNLKATAARRQDSEVIGGLRLSVTPLGVNIKKVGPITITPAQLMAKFAPRISGETIIRLSEPAVSGNNLALTSFRLRPESQIGTYTRLMNIAAIVYNDLDEYGLRGSAGVVASAAGSSAAVSSQFAGSINCAVKAVINIVEKTKDNKNKSTIIRKLNILNDKYFESGMTPHGFQELANASSFRIDIGCQLGVIWQTFCPKKRNGDAARIQNTISLIAHNNHVEATQLKFCNIEEFQPISIFDTFTEPPRVEFVDNCELPKIARKLEQNNIRFESMLSKTNVIAIISKEVIYKERFEEHGLYPELYTPAGVGKKKFIEQCPKFKNIKGPYFNLTHEIGAQANVSGFYMRLGESNKYNIKYDMVRSYQNFKNDLFRGFPILSEVFDISHISHDEIKQSILTQCGLIYIQYPALTVEYLKAGNDIYFEGSGWYPTELVNDIYNRMPQDNRDMIIFSKIATQKDSFDFDEWHLTKDQFRGFIGKCEAGPQQSIYTTYDPVEFSRAKHILGDNINALTSREIADIFGVTKTEYVIYYTLLKKPWNFQIIPAYVKSYQKFNLFKKYNELQKIFRDAQCGNRVKYIAIDGIEIAPLKKLTPAISDIFEGGDFDLWREEPVKVFKSEIRVIKREPPSIEKYSEAPLYIAKPANNNKINFISFLGPAGCGKTYKILELFNNAIYLGPTNECLQSLRDNAASRPEIGNIVTATLHKAFGINCAQKINLHKFSRIIIDEISMISLETFTDCVKKLDAINWSGSIYLVGDFIQLKPVNGTMLYDVKNVCYVKELIDITGPIDTTYMTTNYRQASDTEFYDICQELRAGTLSQCSLDLLNKRVRRAKRIAKLEKLGYTLSGINKQVDAVNNKYSYEIGAPAMINKNIPTLDLYNGNICNIDNIDESGMTTISRGTKIINISLDRLKNISSLAYATTIHKAQGKTIRKPVIINPTRLFADNHLYVAITRATCLKNIYLTKPIIIDGINGQSPDKSDFNDDDGDIGAPEIF